MIRFKLITGYTTFFLLSCLQTKAQEEPIYGSSYMGGLHQQGGFWKLQNGVTSVTPYYTELDKPYGNLISHNGKIYGLSGDKYPEGLQNLTLFEAAAPDGTLKRINGQKFNTVYSFSGVYRSGFTISGNLLIAITHPYEVINPNYPDKLLVIDLASYNITHEVQLPRTAKGTPTLYNGKIYYSTQYLSVKINEYDTASGSSRLISTLPGNLTNGHSGELIADGNFIYVPLQTGQGEYSMWKVNITTGDYEEIYAFETGSNPGNSFQLVNGFYYDLTRASPAIYRLDPTLGEVEIVYDLPDSLHEGIEGLTQLNGKLYGLTKKKNGVDSYSLFEYNPENNTFRIVREYPAIPDEPYSITAVLAHEGELYVYGAAHKSGRKGILSKVNPADGYEQTKEIFSYRRHAFGKGRPVFYKDAFYSFLDSIIYKYDINTSGISVFYDFSGKSGLYADPSPSLTVDGQKLYGVGHLDTVNQVLFSLDLETGEYAELLYLKEETGTDDEMTVYNGNIYLYKGKDVLKFNLATGDTSTIETALAACDYLWGRLLPYGNSLFAGIDQNCSGTEYRNAILQFTEEGNVLKLGDMDQLPGRKSNIGNLESFEDRLYGIFYESGGGGIYSFNPADQDLTPEYVLSNYNLAGRLHRNDATLYFPVYDANFNWYVISFNVLLKSSAIYPLDKDIASGSFISTSTKRALEIKEGWVNAPQLKIYPNPSPGIATLEFTQDANSGKTVIEVLDITGRIVQRQELKSIGTTEIISHTIDMRNQPKGIYQINLTGNDGKRRGIRLSVK